MAAPSRTLVRHLNTLGLAASDDFITAISLARDAQIHRVERNPDTPPVVTRTSALIGASRADVDVLELGMKAGLNWDRLAEGADLGGWSPPSEIELQADGPVHNRVLDALDLYAEHFAEREAIDGLGLAWGLVRVGQGVFLDRIAEAGGDPALLDELWSDALAARSSRELEEPASVAVAATQRAGPRVWVTAGRPDAPQPVDLEDLSVGDEMPWMVPAGVRENDYVLLWVAGGTGFRYVTQALRDAANQSIRGRVAPVADLRVEQIMERPISFGALADDPVLGEWGLVRRKMQGAVRAQPTALSEDRELWPAFVDLAVAMNPHLSSWVQKVAAVARDESTHIDWVSDAAATVDLLHRRPLAEDIARRLDRIREIGSDAQGANTSFLVHLDGPWGSGKSTMLNFLREELVGRDWLVVDFNAWRQSGIGPPWWTLFTALRSSHRDRQGWLSRVKLSVREIGHKVRVAGSLLALATMLAVSALLLYWVADPNWQWATVTDTAAIVGGAVSLGGFLLAGTRVVRRYLAWGTAGAAHRLDDIHEDPMAAIRSYFNWYLRLVRQPVAYLIDDLDRCETEHVVDLLESVQTLIRDAQQAAQADRGTDVKGPYFVVAADGRWIRSSFDEKFGTFSAYVGEPGRPLGYLFLDKIFQLTVRVPILSPSWQDEYLRELLRVEERSEDEFEAEVQALRDELESAGNDDEIFAATNRVSPMVQAQVTGDVLAKLSAPDVEKRRRHALSKFARLLDRNPRSMKRFINTYSVSQGVRYVEHTRVPRDVLALWSIVQTRWPLLAAYLRASPDGVSDLIKGDAPPDLDKALEELVDDGDVESVLTFPVGGPLTPEKIRQCCGTDTD